MVCKDRGQSPGHSRLLGRTQLCLFELESRSYFSQASKLCAYCTLDTPYQQLVRNIGHIYMPDSLQSLRPDLVQISPYDIDNRHLGGYGLRFQMVKL